MKLTFLTASLARQLCVVILLVGFCLARGPVQAAPPLQGDEFRTYDALVTKNARGETVTRDCRTGEEYRFTDLGSFFNPPNPPQLGHYYHFENALIWEGDPGRLYILEIESPNLRWWEIPGCPSPQISFTVSPELITSGQCATLRWEVQNVNAIYLDGQGVEGIGSRQVCPATTSSYSLRVMSSNGEETRSVTLSVSPPARPDYDLAIVSVVVMPPSVVAPGYIPTDFERVWVRVIVENRGTRTLNPSWNFSGQVVLKKVGTDLLELHDFTRSSPTFVSPDASDIQKRSVITIPLYFWHAVADGQLEVVIRPADSAMGLAVGWFNRFTVKPNQTELSRCATFVVRAIAAKMSPGPKKALLDGVAAGGTLGTCNSRLCMVQSIVKLLLKYIGEIPKVIVTIATLNDITEGEAECIVRAEWSLEMLKELQRQGFRVNISSDTRVLSTAPVTPIMQGTGAVGGTPVAGDFEGGGTSPAVEPFTPAPQFPPGVYVTAIQPQPSPPKRNQGVPFTVTFLNTTGTPQNYKWIILVFDPNTEKGFGETEVQSLTVPVGTTQITSIDNWTVRGPGGCVSLYAGAYMQNPDNGRVPFLAPDGSALRAYFDVCP